VLRVIDQVRVLHSVNGDVDLIAVAAATSVAGMDQVIDRIGALDGMECTTSSIIPSFCRRNSSAETSLKDLQGGR
jgi:hypothetical protein